MRKILPVLACLAVLTLPRGAAAQAPDRQLFERVGESIRSYPPYGVFDSIEVVVEAGAVRLSGRVTNPRKRDDIEQRVLKIAGVHSVTNDIGVLPVSPSDDQLRYRVATSIYNHPMFWMHAQRPVPPIHIIVERGRITLTGLADSETQRTMAASLAQVSGSFGVTNRIKVSRR
jgi:hyperosmotically inducible protein